ncbi:MAG: 50S ribosomal protein L11 methyltransferase [Myxococcota bacterium]
MSEPILRFRIDCAEETTREWLLAEAFDAGAGGAEESEFDGRFRADIYAPPDEIEGIRAVLAGLGAPETRIEPVETLPEVDWTEAWKDGLEALEISARLLIRPPFVASPGRAGQQEIVIEPGQAFGTGNHASTRLCLEWIDGLLAGEIPAPPIDRVLDVGTGSGVLALASVALGVREAIGFDLDPVAIEAAEEAARANPNGAAASFFAGPIEAVSGPPFPLVVANLLKKEMLPIADAIASRVAPGGRLVLAGLLEEDLVAVLARFGEAGLEETGRRQRADPIGLWVSPCLGKP